MKEVFEADQLYAAFLRTSQETGWKESVQRYKLNLLREIIKRQDEYRRNQIAIQDTHNFIIHERGHIRAIKSNTIEDRTLMTSFMQTVLLPAVVPKLIYDNGASLKGKGISFSRKRFAIHLNRAWKKYGDKAVIRFFDFRKFFDNIPHDECLAKFRPLLDDEQFEFLRMVFKRFETDLSFLSDEEFASCRDEIYHSLKYHNVHSDAGEKILRKGIGIGSPISQIVGLFYPNDLDTMCKTVLGIECYGRYMDDFYIIGSQQEVDAWTGHIRAKCAELKLWLNEEKIKTYPITACYTYLKIVYHIRQDGSIIKVPHASAFRREKMKLRKYAKLVKSGRSTLRELDGWYKSWRGQMGKYNCRTRLFDMDKYYLNTVGGIKNGEDYFR